MTHELFEKVLRPLGFDVQIFRHNHRIGAEVLKGNRGTSALRWRVVQILSGRNPNALESALSLMCLARLRSPGEVAHESAMMSPNIPI
jgi:hypothetical protein